MALLMQDFGTFNRLHIWVELKDDSLQVNDQTRLLLFVKNEHKNFIASKIEIRLSINPKGPAIMPNPINIEKLVVGRTVREVLPLNIGNSERDKYELRMYVDFQLVPKTWELDPLPFRVQ